MSNTKTIIRLLVKDQVLVPEVQPTVASGGLQEDRIVFKFCTLWDTCTKTAIFYRDPETVYHVLLQNNRCEIPPEILQEPGYIYIGVFGVSSSGVTRTTEVLRYRIVQGALTDATAISDPTPDIYEQILARIARLETVIGINVFDMLGYGTAEEPIDMSTLDIRDFTQLHFYRGTYYVKPLALSGVRNLTLSMHEAQIIIVGDYFINADNCPNFSIFGGQVDGNGAALYGVQMVDSTGCRFDGVSFTNFGNAELENVSQLNIFGDCTGFVVTSCRFGSCTAGVVSSDGYIHAYGLLINRRGSTNSYSASGIVENCTFRDIAGTDTTLDDGTVKKADGDAIFIQAPPYESDGSLVVPVAQIVIRGCTFTDCKKRGVKSSAHGVLIDNCKFSGAFWYAAVDMQYGHNTVKDCRIVNTSDYNGSVTSAVVVSDGGFVVEGCYLSAPYYDAENARETYHPGVRFTTRLPASVIPVETAWDSGRVDRCYFDGVSRGVYAYNSNADADTYRLAGLEITDCRFGTFNQTQAVNVSTSMFHEIDVFRFTDFRFDWGQNRTEVKDALTAAFPDLGRNFTYPVGIGVPVSRSYDLYSRYWTDEPMSGYDGLPTCPHARIIYEGANMGGIVYKEYTTSGSRIVGTKAPMEVTSTLGKQLLYNSRVGDQYTNRTDGTLWLCVVAGTSSAVGTWQQLGASA